MKRRPTSPLLASPLLAFLLICLLLSGFSPLPARAWGGQGHKLVAMVAADHLTPVARSNVEALLGAETLADVASWPDAYRPLETQTALWHYVSIPVESDAYNRDRDCPTQPNVKLGSTGDVWRDCVVDRILFFESRAADTTLDYPDRATALKYLVHFIGDLHQPFHAYGPERGGNGITVVEFGSAACGNRPCNLHAVWDSGLIQHRQLSDADYLALLEKGIRSSPPVATPDDPAAWAARSHALAIQAAVPQNGAVDQAYFDREIPVVDQQLQLAGLRLAAVLNRIFTAPPVPFKPAVAEAKQF